MDFPLPPEPQNAALCDIPQALRAPLCAGPCQRHPPPTHQAGSRRSRRCPGRQV